MQLVNNNWRKNMKIFKFCVYNKIITIILCILLCVDCFAAVVSDNDGSAFITKAEFDSLKNNFQSQIDSYNTSIDSKIDSAIAGYLAGIKADKEEILTLASSVVSYPLTFQMKNKILDWSKWNVNGATPYWAPNYGVYFWGRRSSCTMLIDKTFTTPVVNRTFYNGKWTGSKYKISGMLKDVDGKIDINSCFYQFIDHYGGEASIIFGFVLDQSAAAPRQGTGVGGTITRTLVRASGNSEVNFYSGSSTYPLIVDSIWDWGGTVAIQVQSESTSNEHYLNRLKAAGYAYYEGYTPSNQNFFDSSMYYNSSNTIDFIMNQYDSNRSNADGKRIELPVAYEEHIYMTNKNNFKKDLQNGTLVNASYWNGKYTPSRAWSERDNTWSTVWKFSNIITPGWTLEPQFSGYTRDMNKRSLMEPHYMCYDVTLPYSKVKVEQTMTDGVILTEASRDYKLIKIELNLTSENTAVKKYLVISSDNLISQSDYTQVDSEAAAYPDRYCKIADNKNMKDSVYKYELKEGSNTVYISNIKKNSVLLYKILWDKTNNTYATLTTNPKVNGTFE